MYLVFIFISNMHFGKKKLKFVQIQYFEYIIPGNDRIRIGKKSLYKCWFIKKFKIITHVIKPLEQCLCTSCTQNWPGLRYFSGILILNIFPVTLTISLANFVYGCCWCCIWTLIVLLTTLLRLFRRIRYFGVLPGILMSA